MGVAAFPTDTDARESLLAKAVPYEICRASLQYQRWFCIWGRRIAPAAPLRAQVERIFSQLKLNVYFPAGYIVFRITRPVGCHQSASTGARDTPERRPYHLARAGPRARAPRRGSYNCARAGQRVLAPRRGTYKVAARAKGHWLPGGGLTILPARAKW